MGVTIKKTRKISPKDKDKVHTSVSNETVVTVDGNRITSVKKKRSVSHHKKDK